MGLAVDLGTIESMLALRVEHQSDHAWSFGMSVGGYGSNDPLGVRKSVVGECPKPLDCVDFRGTSRRKQVVYESSKSSDALAIILAKIVERAIHWERGRDAQTSRRVAIDGLSELTARS